MIHLSIGTIHLARRYRAMREVPFVIPVSGVIRIEGDSVEIIVNRASTSISLAMAGAVSDRRKMREDGKTTFDVILDAAREVIRQKGFNSFSAPDLYGQALSEYPNLKRGSFMARVIASTPDHSSFKYHKSNRDFFSHIGPGVYMLNEQYNVDEIPSEEQT
jgi:hypothetical protein